MNSYGRLISSFKIRFAQFCAHIINTCLRVSFCAVSVAAYNIHDIDLVMKPKAGTDCRERDDGTIFSQAK